VASHGVKEYLEKDLRLKLEEIKVQKKDIDTAKEQQDVVVDIKL
jgi:bacterioferritin (cytochrome b1)